MEDNGNWRLTIGKITPASVWTAGSEAEALMPPGVEMWVITQGLSEIDPDDIVPAREQRAEAARILDEWGVDCILSGGSPLSAIEGIEAEEEFLSEMGDELSVPFTTGIRAEMDAFEALDATDILAVTPYPDETNDIVGSYIEEHGFNIVHYGGQAIPDATEVCNMPPHQIYELAKEAAENVGTSYDAIYIPCATWRSADYIEAIECDTGRPVVTGLQAQVWKGLEFGGINPETERYGQLFNTL